jgi:putative Mg2+ transporter-C (MgtC) family protein
MNWITRNCWQVLDPFWCGIVLTLATILAGTIIGVERERHEKPAGLRTIILVCLGAAIFTMASYAFTTNSGDSGRVAAQIVTGIGFLGAGVIMHERHIVFGVTTAATIWVTAAIGLTIGAGHAIPGLALSVTVRLVLGLVQRVERAFLDNVIACQMRVVFAPHHGKTRAKLHRLLGAYHVPSDSAVWQILDPDRVRLEVTVHLAERRLRELAGDIATLEEVESIEEFGVLKDGR